MSRPMRMTESVHKTRPIVHSSERQNAGRRLCWGVMGSLQAESDRRQMQLKSVRRQETTVVLHRERSIEESRICG